MGQRAGMSPELQRISRLSAARRRSVAAELELDNGSVASRPYGDSLLPGMNESRVGAEE